MVDFLKMEKVLSDLEDKSKMLEEDINKAKEVLALLREQYHADTNSSDVNISKLILDRVPELKKCCDFSYSCYLPEEGQDGIQVLSDISKRKIKAKSVLVYVEMRHDYGSSRVYLCEDQVVTCSLNDNGKMSISQVVPYNQIEDINVRVSSSGNNSYFSIITGNEVKEDKSEEGVGGGLLSSLGFVANTFSAINYEIKGYGCHSSAFEIIRTILWDCYEALN